MTVDSVQTPSIFITVSLHQNVMYHFEKGKQNYMPFSKSFEQGTFNFHKIAWSPFPEKHDIFKKIEKGMQF